MKPEQKKRNIHFYKRRQTDMHRLSKVYRRKTNHFLRNLNIFQYWFRANHCSKVYKCPRITGPTPFCSENTHHFIISLQKSSEPVRKQLQTVKMRFLIGVVCVIALFEAGRIVFSSFNYTIPICSHKNLTPSWSYGQDQIFDRLLW